MNALFRQTLESVNVGILVFDRQGKLRYLNPAAEETLQSSAQALRGRHFRSIFPGSPGAIRILRKALEENIAVTGFDVEIRRPCASPSQGAGEEPPALTAIIAASPLSGPSDEHQGAVLSIKSAEILTLVGRDEQAAVSAEETQMLAYGIAHEIKNPLGGILGAAQWILRRETPPEEREEATRLILREANRINGLVEKMLEMGRTPPAPCNFPLLPLLREAADLFEADIRGRGRDVRLELVVDPSLPDVSGHADTIYRVVVNLLKNAVEAVGKRGCVRIEARMNVGLRVSSGSGRKRSFVDVLVSDDGAGMSEEDIRKAVLPFYTTKPGGTGLGLVMVRQAVARHGGKMEIKSVRGKGTTVRISLPVDSRKPSAS